MGVEQAVLKKLQELPPSKQQEVLDFVEFLTARNGQPRPLEDQQIPRQPSMGALAHFGVQITQEDIIEARREMWSNFPREVNL